MRLTSLFATMIALTGCADRGEANFERSNEVGTNNATDRAWTTHDMRRPEEPMLDLDYEAGEPEAVVGVDLGDAEASCARTFRQDGTFELDGSDTCSPRVIYNERVHECDGCDLGEAIGDDLFGPTQVWASTRGTITIVYDRAEDVAHVTVASHMAVGGGNLGDNTAEGEFDLNGTVRLTKLDVDD